MTDRDPMVLAANALLDFSVGWDASGTDEGNDRAYHANLAHLNEIGAVKATMDDEEGVLSLQMAPLINGAAVVIHCLIQQLAAAHEIDRDDVVAELRAYLDGLEGRTSP